MYNATMEIINQYELIDTCWNVNVSSAWIALIIPGELIDTCWNVN